MRTRALITCLLVLLLVAASTAAWAGQPPAKCNGSYIANGPFGYTPSDAGTVVFQGSSLTSSSTSFVVTAPNAQNAPSSASIVFPGNGTDFDCPTSAIAVYRVFEIEQVEDANGNSLDPTIPVAESSSLYGKIAAAFVFVPHSPSTYTFTPGSSNTVDVTITNPIIDAAYYGTYSIKLGAQAAGYGIGVGPGSIVTLKLLPATLSDTVPPVVSVNASNQYLGPTLITVTATDPEPGSGVNASSVSATVVSVEKNFSQELALTLDSSLPTLPAGTPVHGSGTFNPIGGPTSDESGTTPALAFTGPGNYSGIGDYVVSAQANDMAGNSGSGSARFTLKYYIEYLKNDSPNCATNSNGKANGCTFQLQFKPHRDATTSDGKFMFDHTVKVEVLSGSQVVASHTYGTGDINLEVQIKFTDLVNYSDAFYETKFKRSDVSSQALPGTYTVKIYFKNVDGEYAEQSSFTVSF